MLNVRKHRSLLIVSLLIVLGVAVIAAKVTLRPSPASTNHVSSTPSHIVQISFSLAHEYRSLKELKKDSVLIVLGSVRAQKTVVGNHGLPTTISTLTVVQTLMGHTNPSQTVLVRQPGGKSPDGTLWMAEEFPLLQIGTQYILFLTPSPDPTVLYPVGAPQGVFSVSASQSVNALSNVGVSVKDVPLKTFIQNIQSA